MARRSRSILRGVMDSNGSPKLALRRAFTSHTTSTPSRQATTSSSPRGQRQLRATMVAAHVVYGAALGLLEGAERVRARSSALAAAR